MKKFIEKMQTKSDSEKRIFAFWMATMITLFIFGIWLLNFLSVFGINNNSEIKTRNEANPFGLLVDEVKKVIDSSDKVYQAK